MSEDIEASSEGNNETSLPREPESMVDTNLRYKEANVKSTNECCPPASHLTIPLHIVTLGQAAKSQQTMTFYLALLRMTKSSVDL